MEKNFKKSTANFGCYVYDKNSAQHRYLPNEDFTVNDVLKADVPLEDKFWFVRNNCKLTTDESVQLAIGCAGIVLPIYEAKYPEDKAPREAVQAAQDFLNGSITLSDLLVKRDAAYAAADAAYAAYADAAAYAYAAYAADAAYAAADAAYADAAYAAADAAADAAYAADAAPNYSSDLLSFLTNFVK